MERFEEIIFENNYGWILGAVMMIYYVLNFIYYVLSKSDLEKSTTYPGKDRVKSSLLIFLLYYSLILLVSFEDFQNIQKENNIWIALLTIFVVTLFFYIIFIVLTLFVYALFIKLGWIKRFEVKYNDNFWLIMNVTRDNRVILKNDKEYLILPSIQELENKTIQEYEKTKINKKLK